MIFKYKQQDIRYLINALRDRVKTESNILVVLQWAGSQDENGDVEICSYCIKFKEKK